MFHAFLPARDDPRHCPKITREVSVIDFLRGSDGHYYKGRTKQVLPSIPKRTIPPSCDTRTVDQSSIKGKQVSPTDTATSLSADHRQVLLVFIGLECSLAYANKPLTFEG